MEPTDYTDNLEQSQESTQHPHLVDKEEFHAAMEAANKLVRELEELPDGDLVAETVVNAIKLLRDRNNRGDLKLVNKSFKELRYALKVFTPYRDTRKVSIFGSARTPEDHPDYIQCSVFAKEMAALGWMVITGAGGGIMAAGHGGAGADPSFGLAIRLPFEQDTNPFIAKDKKLINFKYFFTRKLMFVRSAHAIALFPGGFGTMDEGFEVLTLIQTGKSAPMPIVLVDAPGGQYWKQWDAFVRTTLLGHALVSDEDLHLYKVTDNAEEAVREITHFYSNFHSIRYHRDDLVIRLRQKPSATQLEQLARDFADVTTSGTMSLSGPLPVEKDEPDLKHLHRLIFSFNKRNQGRLRLLINRLNDLGA
jgi:uncharacterized protein (TIGR00730 family)